MDRLTALLARMKRLLSSRPRLIAGVVGLALLLWVAAHLLTRSFGAAAAANPARGAEHPGGAGPRLAHALEAQRQRTLLSQWEPFDYIHDGKAGERFVAARRATLEQPAVSAPAPPTSSGGLLDIANRMRATSLPPLRGQPRPMFNPRAMQEVKADVYEAMRDFNQSVIGP
jgi:hypothetical protein